jgi:periplasmic protein TonB
MTVRSLAWFEDDEPRDLRRWIFAAAVVVCIHLAAIAAYLYVHRPDELGDDSEPVAVDFSPADDTVDQPEIAPQPEQPQQPPPQVEQPPPPPPPPPQPEAAVTLPEVKPIEQPPAPPPTPPAPARTKGGTPHVDASWQTELVKHLQQFKRYPTGSQSRGEEGVVLLSFGVDRNGHVLSHQIARSSGFPDLDAEVMSMIERAQPLPVFPPSMVESKLDLTVPIRFSLR